MIYLKRGGRISPASYFVGNLLGIKPVLHMDDDGHLISMAKVRGRRTSVMALADKYGQLAEDKAGGTVFISHADCMADAEFTAVFPAAFHRLFPETSDRGGGAALPCPGEERRP